MTRSIRPIMAFVVLLSLESAAAGQNRSNWQQVESLNRGTHVKVAIRGGSEIGGSIVDVTPASIVVRADGVPRDLPVDQVRRVRAKSAGRQLLRLIGIPAGLVAGFFACPQCANGNEGSANYSMMLLGGGIGAATLFIPAYRTVYEVP